jgi:hypothetical protein
MEHYVAVVGFWKRGQKAAPEVLFDVNTVDVVAQPADGSVVDLVIVNDSPWTGSDAQIRSLQHKIHAYISFALDGQMTRTYPETVGLAWRIVIVDYAGPIDPRTSSVIERTVEPVRNYGGDLIFKTP